MNNLRILFSFLFITIFSSSLFAEIKPTVSISLGYGYILNDTPKHIYDTKDYHLYTKFRPAISIEFKQHHLKLDFQNFGYEENTFETVTTDEITSWDVKDITLKYGQSILGKQKLKLSALTGVGLLVWERQYQKNYLKKN